MNPLAPAKKSSKSSSWKPALPYEGFPLFPHRSGQWCKKILGRHIYFGPWEDWQAALKLFQDQRDDLYAGKPLLAATARCTVKDLVNRFLTAKQHRLDSGEITARTFSDYKATCGRIVAAFGRGRAVEHLDAEDFEKFRARLAKTMGVVALATEIQRARVVFRFAYLQRLVHQPVRYDDFKPPSKKTLRLARHAKGPRMFEATDLRNLLDRAGTQLKAMLLLGINCGMGNSDVGHLEFRHANLETGWVDYPRPKTGVLRRFHLWPETVAALNAAIAARPEPKDAGHAKLVFITKPGAPWFKSTSDNPISRVMAVLLKELKLHRPGLNFYALRHTFETVAGESRDQVAVDHIMGRARDDMASVYRERISDERLKAVSEHVRRWLFPPKKRASKGSQR